MALVVAALLVLPWVVPAVPTALSGLLPSGDGAPGLGDAPVLTTPTTDPPTEPDTEPGTVLRSLKGTRHPAAGVPRRLVVDRAGVRSGVVPISGESGVLLPPSDPHLLGWWREGAVPGAARGTAVLTGHTVSTGGGAFDHLGTLARGDEVVVRTGKGAIHYVVTSSRTYGTAALARQSREIFRLDGAGRLVLITCSGYDGRVYRSNTVVTAVPVG
jgi:LPXTG-site transpeptidase (sortase) family protein